MTLEDDNGLDDLWWVMYDIDEDELEALGSARGRALEKGITIARSNSLDLYEDEQTFDWSRIPPSAYHWLPLVNLKSILESGDGLLSRTYLDLKNMSREEQVYLDVSDRELSAVAQ